MILLPRQARDEHGENSSQDHFTQPKVDCENTHSTKATCDADSACAWCTSAAVPPSCERIAVSERVFCDAILY